MRSSRSRERDDVTSMTMSGWMDITPSEWMDRMRSGWESGYSDLMNTRPSEWWQMLYGAGMGQPAAPSRWEERRHRHRHHHHRCECGEHHHHEHCRHCRRYPCECYCCIGDVDLAVYSHLGEQRVISFVVENERQRDKEITLDFSDWTTRGGKEAPVETVLLEPKTFTLPPCGEQTVTLIVKVNAGEATRISDKTAEATTGAADNPPERTKLPDVDDCLVAMADLRLVGCDHRPLRIAVAVMPRDCDPYRVHCGCTCC